MKKLLSLIIVLSMVFTLAACGGNSSGNNGSSTTPAADDAATSEVEPLTISFSTTYNETETGGQVVKKWTELLSEKSGGNITVDVVWGGTLFSDADILDGLESNAVNMTLFGHMPHIGTLNYLGFPTFAPGGTKAALDFFDEIIFNNAETSALITDELAEHNVVFLATLPGGANAFCSSFEFKDFASLVAGSKSFGNMDAAIFEALGFQVTSVAPPDCYDALQRGLIDSTQMGLTPMASMQWYQVAPYWALDGTYAAGNFISANLNWWNGLSDAQKNAITEASKEVAQWSLALYDDEIGSNIETIETETGNKFVEFSQEDLDNIWAANFESKAAAAMTTAEANGKAEGMRTILELAAQLTNYDWKE